MALGSFQKVFKDFAVGKGHDEIVRAYLEASKKNKDKKNINFYEFIEAIHKLLETWGQLRKIFHLND